MSVVASSGSRPPKRKRDAGTPKRAVGTPKRAAGMRPSLGDLGSVKDLGMLFDLLDLPNGPNPMQGNKTASKMVTEDLVNSYGWVFSERLPAGHRTSVHAPSAEYSVPLHERPTASISGKTTAMLRRYNQLFNRGTTQIGNGLDNVMLRLPADWTERKLGPKIYGENVRSLLIELEAKVTDAIEIFSSPHNGAIVDGRATSEEASQKAYAPQDQTWDHRWCIWRHRKYMLFHRHDEAHNELVRRLQGADFTSRVTFVDRTALQEMSPQHRAGLTVKDPSEKFYFDPLLWEVKYDDSVRPAAPQETDRVERWSPVWIERRLNKVTKLTRKKALPHLECLLAHLKDINGHTSSSARSSDVKLEAVYVKDRDNFYDWRNRYLLSPQEMIKNAMDSKPRSKIRANPKGEMNVERSFDPFIVILRDDNLTELESNCKLHFPPAMQPFSTTPKPDIAFRMIPEPWSKDRKPRNNAPAIFIGEAKTEIGGDGVLAQIAMSVHPNLLLLVLYYLDHRKYGNDPAPDWLFFFSFRYFTEGFIIYGHYFEWDIQAEKFKFWMAPVAEKRYMAFMVEDSDVENLKVVSTLGSIRSHNHLLAEMLSRWDGPLRKKYEELCPPL